MDLVKYWKVVVLERYATFDGRARRAEFWWFALANIVINIVLSILGEASGLFAVISVLYGLAVLVPGIAVGVRRLHDIDKSGWFLLLALIPIVGAIILLVWAATDGTRGPNRYGASEKYPS
ncbi:MAG: hypothetical protein RI958_963 [Actinomycetota bacterium]